jgi:hypothetical protein
MQRRYDWAMGRVQTMVQLTAAISRQIVDGQWPTRQASTCSDASTPRNALEHATTCQ